MSSSKEEAAKLKKRDRQRQHRKWGTQEPECQGGPFLIPVINDQELIGKKIRAAQRRAAKDAVPATPADA